MNAKIINIGNSKGIRIPKHILEELQFEEEAELIVSKTDKAIVLRPIRKTREGWENAFMTMSKHEEDKLIIDDGIDLNDWEW